MLVANSLTRVLCEVKIQRITGPNRSSVLWDFDLLKKFEFVISRWRAKVIQGNQV
ncbi:MAG: hypothetical protein QOE96_669 [Blastocatellia bacterium]|nr:hypothetical protein [Blastocatellia bacterium]